MTAHSHVLSEEFGSADVCPEESEDIMSDFLGTGASDPMYGSRGSPLMGGGGTRKRTGSSSSSASGLNRSGRSLTQRLLAELRQQLHECEAGLGRTHLIALEAYQTSTGRKYKGVDSLGFLRSSSKGAGKSANSKTRTHASAESDSDTEEGTDITLQGQHKELRGLGKRVKQLGDNTSKACRSLSVGLTDVQQATLFLYAWCDKAHDAFGVLSAQLGMSSNICPRVQVYRQNKPQQAQSSNTSQLDNL